MLTPQARSETSLRRFARAYRRAATTATLSRVAAGRAGDAVDDTVTVPMTASTRIFGDFEAPVTLPLGEDVGGEPAIEWAPHLVFPGLRRGEELTRETHMPDARDDPRPRRVADGLRRGPAVRPRPGGVRDRRPDRPRAARAGRRAGGARRARRRPGRHQRARARVRRRAGRHARAASCWPARACWPASRRSAASSVRTTIDPDIQRAAVQALAGRYGGIAAVRPRTGEVLALAGRRLLGPAAAGLGVQDRHADGGARGADGPPQRELPGPDGGDARGGRARERQRRVVRRVADQLLRALVQLGVRADGRRARGREAGRGRRALRVQRGPAARRGPRARRSRRPPRSATTWPSARRRSARARCSPRRSRWR